MKSNFKRAVSLVLAVLMVFTVVPFSGFAAGEWDCSTDGHVFDGTLIPKADKHAFWCSKCNEFFGYMDEDGNPVANSYQNCYSETPATCKDKAVCDVCEREFGELSNVHGATTLVTESKYLKSAANCKNPAVYYLACTVCREKTDATQASGFPDPNTHIYGAAVSNNNGTHKATCTLCGTGTENIACYDAEPTVIEPGCTTGGHTKNICDACEYEWISNEKGAKGHDYSEKIINEAHLKDSATCKDKATYWYDCKNCNANAKDDALATDKFYTDANSTLEEHSFTAVVEEPRYLATAGTCRKKATYYVSCSVCELSSKGTTSQATFEGAFGDHSYTKENPIDSRIASQATCMAKAKYYKSCVYCGATSKDTDFEATFEHGNKAAHNWGTYTYNNNAKCGVDGSETAKCQTAGCNETDTRTKANTALEHNFTKEVTTHKRSDATCTAKATYWLGCSNGDCNAFATEETAPNKYFESGTLLDHNFTAEVVAEKYLASQATCKALAKYYKSCSVCNISSKDLEGEATFETGTFAPHSYTDEKEDDLYNRTEATCLEQATRWFACTGCGNSAKDVEGVAKPYYSYGELKAHNYTQEVRDDKYIVEGHEATCTTDAIYWYVCSQEGCFACAKDDESGIPEAERYYTALKTQLGHDPEDIPAVEPTCDKAGSTAGIKCKTCKMYIVEPQPRAALGHKEYVSVPAVAATCTKPGSTEEKRCATCQQLLTMPSMTIPKLGHVDADGDEICDREGCGSLVTAEAKCTCICHQSGIMGVIAYIVVLIWKLLGVNQHCECGAQHY